MKRLVLLGLCLCLSLSVRSQAADEEYRLLIKDHRFSPAELHVPAGKKFRLIVANQDSTSEEFESHELNREKVVPGGGQVQIFLGPLDAGRYPFFGEYNDATARGVIVAQ